MSFQEGPDDENGAVSIELSQRNFLWDAELQLRRVEPLFETNQTGFLFKEPFRGWQQLDFEANYGPRWGPHRVFVSGEGRITQALYDGAYFTTWRADNPGLELAADFEQDLLGWEGEISTGMELTKSLISFFSLYYERSRQIELTDVFNANEYRFFVETNSARTASVEIEGQIGDFFNFSRQAVGKQRLVSLFGTVRPQANLALQAGSTLAQTLDQDSEVDGRFLVGSLRLTYLFTRDTFLRIFTQTDRQRLYVPDKETTAGHLFSALLGWEYSPKSHFFIAYNENWGDTRLDGRVLLLKLSYLANL